MTAQEYSNYYIDYIVTSLGPSVKREAENDPKLAKNPERQAILENYKNGLIIISQVAFIESNFMIEGLRNIRNFTVTDDEVPNSINPVHLSCFFYMRDCFAHDPTGVLFPDGQLNTDGFKNAIHNREFKWATISDESCILINPASLHQLHRIILDLFK